MASFPVPGYASDLPFSFELFAAHKVPKVCTACGTSRTPQWREGPEGPKTLCNACGVKRCRQLRITSDGKRKPAPRLPPAALGPEDLEDEEEAFNMPLPKLQRKAYGKGFSAWQALDSDSHDTRAPSPSGGIGPAASSDSAEEEFWSPHGPAVAPAVRPSSPTYEAVAPECAAAINLLAMSLKPAASDRPQLFTEAGHGAPVPVKHGLHHLEDSCLDQGALPFPAAQQPRLHPNHHLLLEMRELERQAVVAEAAVSAVAQVLAKKQALATQARFALAQAQKRARIQFECS